MATQADWRMILGIRQQPNQWAEALSNLPSNLVQGLQIGDYFRQRSRENQLQELMRGAIDQQTGEVDQGKMLQAIIQTYPEKAPALAAEMRKQYQYEQSQQALQQFMTGAGAGAGAGAGGLAIPKSVQALAVAGAGGDPGKALENLAGFENAWQLKTLDRAQELIPGVVDTPNGPVEVTDTRENWSRYRQQQQPSGGTPAPATGEARIAMPPAISPTNPSIGAVGGDIPLEMIRNLSPADREKLYSQLTPGQVAVINQALSQLGTVSAQTPFAPTQRNKAAPGVPGIPGGPAATGLPPGAIQRGLSLAQQQQFDIQKEERAKQRQIEEENRANRAKSNLMLQQDYLTSQRQIERDALEQNSAEAIAYSRKTAEERVAMSKGWRENYEAATKAMPLINEMENYIKEGALDEGSLAGIYGKIGGLMYSLGAREDGKLVIQNRMNRGFDSTANQLTFAKLGEKLGAQISDADREFILTFSPKVGDQPEAAKRMIRILKDAFNRNINQYAGWLKSGKPNEFDYQVQWNNNLMDEFSKQQEGQLKFNHPQQDEVDKIKAQLLRGRR